MMKEEFEMLAGYEVSFKDYNDIIEPMYMATNLTKEEFVEVIDKKRFALKSPKAIVKEMRKIAQHLKETCTHYTDYEAKEKLEMLAHEYIERKGLQGVASYFVRDVQHQCCYYPVEIEIYFTTKNFATYEIIKLV